MMLDFVSIMKYGKCYVFDVSIKQRCIAKIEPQKIIAFFTKRLFYGKSTKALIGLLL